VNVLRERWRVHRRAALRGLGASIALPLLEQMLPRKTSAWAAGADQRLIVVFKPNGTYMPTYLLAKTGTGWALPPALEPLKDHVQDLMIVSGLQNKVTLPFPSLHLAGVASWLTGVHSSPTANGVSMDQVVAKAWAGKTTFDSLELGAGTGVSQGTSTCDGIPCGWGFSISYADERTPKPTEYRPEDAFDRLFGGFKPAAPGATQPTAEQMAAAKRRAQRQSILDAVKPQTQRLRGKLGASDARRIDGYLTAIRDLEVQLQASATGGGGVAGASCGSPTRPAGGDYPANMAAMMSVIALAVQCDRTRVVTLMMGEMESDVEFSTFLPVFEAGHHETSHHSDLPARTSSLTTIDRWHVTQLASLLGKLKSVVEPDGMTLLDKSLVLHGSEISDGNSHSFENMPVLLAGKAGGRLAPGGRHVAFPDRPLADLHLAIIQMMGVSRSSFGNGTAPLSLT
jgi:hypothetical protein